MAALPPLAGRPSFQPESRAAGVSLRLTFEDALEELPRLRELAQEGSEQLGQEDRRLLSDLVEATLNWKWSNKYRTWQDAEESSCFLRKVTTPEALRAEMEEVLQCFAKSFTSALREEPVWAAENLALLVDERQKLYDNRVSSYPGTGTGGDVGGTYTTQEGATFLKGVAAATFFDTGGFKTLVEALASAEGQTKVIHAIVELLNTLHFAKGPSSSAAGAAALEACCGAAGDALQAVPEKALVESREEVQRALKHLLWHTRAVKGGKKPPCRAPIEAAWRRAILAGLRSTNLQARRAAADALADSRRSGISAAELAPWLEAERVLEELFGDRLDPRVLEELSLEPLCDPSADGLRELLPGLERGLGHAVLYKKLHELATLAPDAAEPPAWGRSLVVVELMRWIRRLLGEGRPDAVALTAGFFSCSSTSFNMNVSSHNERDCSKRIFAFISNGEAAREAMETLTEALLQPRLAGAHLVALEAAFDDARTHASACVFLRQVLDRLVAQVEAVSSAGAPPLAEEAVRLLFRTLQAYPVGETDPGASPDFTREAALSANERLPEMLRFELRKYIEQADVKAEAVQWRLRLICFAHRCAARPSDKMTAEQLGELLTLLAPLDGGAHLCFLLRVGSAVSTRYPGSALAPEATERSLEFLEEWAEREKGLTPAAFFCLQQAIILVNGRQNRMRFFFFSTKEQRTIAITPDVAVMTGIQEASEPSEVKGPSWQMVGRWVVVLQVDGYSKLARLGKYDEVTENFNIEYIDEVIHRRSLSWLARWRLVPPLEEQEPTPVRTELVKDPSTIAGTKGLWSCALGVCGARTAKLATDMLLSLHQGPDGTRRLLQRLLSGLQGAVSADTVGRGLLLMETLVQQQPLGRSRAHRPYGFPFRLTLVEYDYVWVEAPKNRYQAQFPGASVADTERRRAQIATSELRVHSHMTLEELHSLAAATLDKRSVELWLRGASSPLPPHGQATLLEARLGAPRVLEAEVSSSSHHAPPMDGPLDDLGQGEAPCLERLLELLKSNQELRNDQRRLCWQLLLRLPTHSGLLAIVKEPSGKDWLQLLSTEDLWRSGYLVLLIDATMSPLSEGALLGPSGDALGEADDATMPKVEAEQWFNAFEAAGGTAALIELLIGFVEARIGPTGATEIAADYELAALLPPLVRAVGACTLSHRGGSKEALGPEGGTALVRAASISTKWLFNASRAQDDRYEGTVAAGPWWRRLHLRQAAANGLDLLVAVQQRAELPLAEVGDLVLPHLVDVAQEVEGCVHYRVVRAMVEVARRPGAIPLLLKRLAAAVPAAAVGAGAAVGGSAPLFDVALEVVCALGDQVMAQAEEQCQELAGVVAKAVIDTRCSTASLYRLLRTLLKAGPAGQGQGATRCAIVELGSPLADNMLRCVLPEEARGLADDHTREQAAQALLCLLDLGDWDMRCNVLRRVVGYLATSPTPTDSYDFEPTVPKEPNTSPAARRNETNHVGLLNRGMTCYMNSTVQQLFWSLPFRTAVLAAAPPVAEQTPGKPEPLPERKEKPASRLAVPKAEAGAARPVPPSGTASSNTWYGPVEEVAAEGAAKSIPTDVGWHLQRAFAYLQDCNSGQFNTDGFVKACSCLNLEYAVTSQNDAAEFFDKLCDTADTVYSQEAADGGGPAAAKPGNVFLAKTCREKECHHCKARTKGREDEMKRVQLSALCETLELCLEELTAAETMAGDNRVDCDHCGPKRDTTYRTYFTQLPQVLVLNLARITFDLETLERVKKNPRISFPLKLNMAKYTEDAVVHGAESVPGCTYELQGVQIHQGSASSGHYYSFVQDAVGKWYKFNDDRVSAFDLEDLDDECFGGEDYHRTSRSGRSFEKSYNAYMLYYRCVDASPYRAAARSLNAAGTASSTPAAAAATSIGPPSEGGTAAVPTIAAPGRSPEEPEGSIVRSRSATMAPPRGPPPLARNITNAYSGELLADRQRRRRQMQLRSDLRREIEETNTRLHRQEVVFSAPTRQFVLDLTSKLVTPATASGLVEGSDGAAAGTSAGAPLAAARALGARTSLAEALCRLTAKALFDVVLHARAVGEEQLRPWSTMLGLQLLPATAGAGAAVGSDAGAGAPASAPAAEEPAAAGATGDSPDAARWLLARLAGEPDPVLGRGTSSWLPKILFDCKGHDDRFPPVAEAIVAAAQSAAATGAEDSLRAFLEALLLLMSGVRSATALGRYGALWARLTEPIGLRTAIANHRGVHGSPVSSLLLHLFIGGGSTPLPAPPAPPLVPAFITPLRRNADGTSEECSGLLRAVDTLLRTDPQLAEESIVSSIALWRSLAREAPEVFMQDGPLREAVPKDVDSLAQVAQVIIEALRPSGAEDVPFSTLLRSALVFVLRLCDSAGRLEEAVRTLAEVGQQLLTMASGGSGLGSGVANYSGYSGLPRPASPPAPPPPTDTRVTNRITMPLGPDGSLVTSRRRQRGQGNPEAVQLLRLLQVVVEVVNGLPQDWQWARDWLLEVCDKRSFYKWESGGVPVAEVRRLCKQLALDVRDPAEEAEDEADNETIKVDGAGSEEVNGYYTWSHNDEKDNPHYENMADPSYVLYRQVNGYGDSRWVLVHDEDDKPIVLYRTDWDWNGTKSDPYGTRWYQQQGRMPLPLVEVVTGDQDFMPAAPASPPTPRSGSFESAGASSPGAGSSS